MVMKSRKWQHKLIFKKFSYFPHESECAPLCNYVDRFYVTAGNWTQDPLHPIRVTEPHDYIPLPLRINALVVWTLPTYTFFISLLFFSFKPPALFLCRSFTFLYLFSSFSWTISLINDTTFTLKESPPLPQTPNSPQSSSIILVLRRESDGFLSFFQCPSGSYVNIWILKWLEVVPFDKVRPFL